MDHILHEYRNIDRILYLVFFMYTLHRNWELIEIKYKYVKSMDHMLLKRGNSLHFFGGGHGWPVEDASVAPPNAHNTRAIPGAALCHGVGAIHSADKTGYISIHLYIDSI